MSTPIIEQIAEGLVALVGQVTIANGYNQDLVVDRPKRLHLEGDLNTNNQVLIEQTTAEVTDSTTSIFWQQGFAIQAFVIDSDDATDPIDKRLNMIRSDIEKVLATDEQLGGLAKGILLDGAERFPMYPDFSGVSVNIFVLYEVSSSDPYTQA